MRAKLITTVLVLLALLVAADWLGGEATAIPWRLIIGLPIVALVVSYMGYLMYLKVSGKAANKAHDERVGARMPKIIGGGIAAIILAAAVPHYGSILVNETKAWAGGSAGGVASSFDATATSAEAALPPAWVMIAVPALIAAGIAFILRGRDTEAKTVRTVAVILTGLACFVVSVGSGVLA